MVPGQPSLLPDWHGETQKQNNEGHDEEAQEEVEEEEEMMIGMGKEKN